MLMYIFSFIDRTTISLIVEPMKRDLNISDTQIGMLQGLAFALLYTFLGLPIARLSDRFSRRAIIAAGVFIWSIMATLCGLARTAMQLFIARIGVGVGEAALSPAAYSIITDSFPRSRLGSAFGVYNIGITIGAGVAFLVGGIVVAAVSHAGASYTLPLFGEVRAWQMVFIVTGAPGILLPLLLLTFREPARRGLLRTQTDGGDRCAAQTALERSSPLCLVEQEILSYALRGAGIAVHVRLLRGGVAADRAYPCLRSQLRAGRKGLGVSTIVMNSSGMLIAGIPVRSPDAPGLERCAHRGRIALRVRHCLFGCLPSIMPTVPLVWMALFVAGLTFNAYNGVGPMAVNQVTPNQYRAQVSAVYLFVVNALGSVSDRRWCRCSTIMYFTIRSRFATA